MNDDVKKALEELTQTFAIVHRVATHQTDDAYMSIPANPKRDADLRHAAAVEALRAHIDAEPERLAAAVAREREEQREADVRSCPTCKGEGFTMRVRECPFCNDSTHDHECPTDEVRVYCACGAARIRATPLTATPLADELRTLRAKYDELHVAAGNWLRQRDLAFDREEAMRAERDTALARVRELEATLSRNADDKSGLLNGPGSGTWSVFAERQTARAEKAEAERDAALLRVSSLQKWWDLDVKHLHAERDAALARVKELEQRQPTVEELEYTRAMAELGQRRDNALDPDLSDHVHGLKAERDALKARVAELEEANVRRQVALEAERDELRQRILDSCPSPDEGGRIHAGGRIVCGQCHDSEVSHLRAQLAEATSEGTLSARIGAVREALGMSEFDSAVEVEAVERLKAQLADAEKLNAHYVERIRELQEADAMTQLAEAVAVLKSFADAVQMFDVDFVDAEAEEAAGEALSQARHFLAKVKL